MSASGTPQKKLGRFEVKTVPEEILARLAQPAKQVGALACLLLLLSLPCPARVVCHVNQHATPTSQPSHTHSKLRPEFRATQPGAAYHDKENGICVTSARGGRPARYRRGMVTTLKVKGRKTHIKRTLVMRCFFFLLAI